MTGRLANAIGTGEWTALHSASVWQRKPADPTLSSLRICSSVGMIVPVMTVSFVER